MEASHSVVTDWIAAMDAKGLDGQGLVDGAKAAIAKYEGGS
jgi:hypothetical protein